VRKEMTWVGLGEEKESCLFSSLRPGSHTSVTRADGP
jgi:hypothetical protein